MKKKKEHNTQWKKKSPFKLLWFDFSCLVWNCCSLVSLRSSYPFIGDLCLGKLCIRRGKSVQMIVNQYKWLSFSCSRLDCKFSSFFFFWFLKWDKKNHNIFFPIFFFFAFYLLFFFFSINWFLFVANASSCMIDFGAYLKKLINKQGITDVEN